MRFAEFVTRVWELYRARRIVRAEHRYHDYRGYTGNHDPHCHWCKKDIVRSMEESRARDANTYARGVRMRHETALKNARDERFRLERIAELAKYRRAAKVLDD